MGKRQARALAIVVGSLVLFLATYLILTGATPIAPMRNNVILILAATNYLALFALLALALSWVVGIVRGLITRR